MARKNLEKSIEKPDARHYSLQQLSDLNHLAGMISQSGDLLRALNNTIDQLLVLTHSDVGTIHLLEDKSKELRLKVWRGV